MYIMIMIIHHPIKNKYGNFNIPNETSRLDKTMWLTTKKFKYIFSYYYYYSFS